MAGNDHQNTEITPRREQSTAGSAPVSLLSPTDPVSPRRRRSPSVAQAILLSSTVAQLCIALLITIFLARVLSAAAFGFFSLVGTIFILARKFLDLGLSNVAARETAGDPGRERSMLEGMMAYRRVAGVVLAMGLFVFAVVQHGQTERWILLAAGIVLLFTEPAALDSVFQVRQAQGGPALLNVFGGLLVLCGSFVLRSVGEAGAMFAWLLIAREAVSLFFTKLMAERLLGYRPTAGFRGRSLRAFAGPALLFGLASLVYTIYFNCDVFFVYVMRGKEELGAYAAAFRPINPLLLLPWLLMVPMIPVLTALAMDDREQFVRQVRGACAVALGLGACAAVAGTLLAPDLVQVLYRGRYLEGTLSCVDAFRWLAVALGQVCVTTVLTAAMLADRREKLLLMIGVAALVANAAINVLLLRHYNFTAAGFATAVTELLYLVGAVVAFAAVTRRSPLAWSGALYLLPAIVVGGILYRIPGSPALRVSCGILLGLLSVAAILLSPGARRFRKEISAATPAF